MKTALIIVDIQNDFVPGGALGVNEGDQIIPVVNRLMDKVDLVVATQDYHPVNHGSFADVHIGRKTGEVIDLFGLNQVLWPVHCLQGTYGAEFHSDLDQDKIVKIFPKGENPKVDSYSGFFDNGRKFKTGLDDYLKEQQVDVVYVVGLATDYCVKFTALDAVELCYETYVIRDATRAVNLEPGDGEKAFSEMEKQGVKVIHSNELINPGITT